jgi:integrase
VLRPAPFTFERRKDAADWLAETQTELRRGEWINPDAGRVLFRDYATAWVAERDLAETTRERYDVALRNHVLPTFGNTEVGKIREPTVRAWRKERQDSGIGRASIAKAYRLLHAIFNTAVDDGLIRRNPCRIKGASADRSPEREAVTLDQVFRILDTIPERYRALVLLGIFASLRFGELASLRRRAVDLDNAEIWVRKSQAELCGGRLVDKDPKSDAGRRIVAIPSMILPELREHLARFAEPGRDGRVFVGPKGGRLRRRNFLRVWTRTLAKVGLGEADVHFHDLRHTGNQLAAETGATTRELMARMGHASPRAALIYQHATRDRDRHIADQIDASLSRGRKADPDAEGHAGGTEADEQEAS